MQFSKGFTGCILEEDNAKVRRNILLYLQQLYQDAQETNWYTAKSAHKILLLEMERITIKYIRYELGTHSFPYILHRQEGGTSKLVLQ